jgi:hypothetical protein
MLASFGEMTQFASGGEKCMLIVGYFFAVCAGAILPAFIFMLGPVFDSFGDPTSDPDATLKEIREITLIMAGLALSIMVAAYFQYSLTIEASQRIVAKFRKVYL